MVKNIETYTNVSVVPHIKLLNMTVMHLDQIIPSQMAIKSHSLQWHIWLWGTIAGTQATEHSIFFTLFSMFHFRKLLNKPPTPLNIIMHTMHFSKCLKKVKFLLKSTAHIS